MLFTEKSVVEVIATLRKRGYTADFNLLEENLSYVQNGEPVDYKDLVIDRVYRFTGMSDLDDESTLYAMQNLKDGMKGVFINGYGIYSDAGANKVLAQIPERNLDHEDWGI